MSVLASILLTLILIIINGYFSMSEMALVNARRAVLQQEDEEGDKKAEKALEVASDEGRVLATIQVAITIVGFFASAAASTQLSEPLAKLLAGTGFTWLAAIAPPLAVIIITLLVAYITIVFGELVPKRIALSSTEKVAKQVAGPINGFSKLFKPLVFLVNATTNGVAKLFRIKGMEDRQQVSEEEIKYLVTEQDDLLDEEKRMIHEIFDLGDMVAREVMVPRVDMTVVEDDMTVEQVMRRMQDTGFSRLPVFHEDHDHIIGIAMIKDLIEPLIQDRGDDPITRYLRDVVFVPDTKDILPLLSEMQTSHQQMAIVVDEYGGTAGLITIEDIVEEIVGEIADEYDPDNKYLTRLGENSWLVDGRFPIDDCMEQGFPVEESDEYETIAGWVLDTMDTLPQTGDSFTVGEYTFKVQTMRRRRISTLRITRVPAPEPAPEEDDE